MKPMKYLLAVFAALQLTACDSEKSLNIIEGELPIKTTTLYMVGDATPNGWNIGNPTAYEATAEDALVFQWEGQLYKGEIKLCLTTGSWEAPFIRPTVAGTEINKTNITNAKFAMHAGDPDDKWLVTEAGKYRLTFDLRHWTMSTAYLGEPETPTKDPINAEAVYIVGDATPNGWNIDAPTQLTKQSQYIFTYEGTLTVGELKACTQTGSWDVPFIRPAIADCKINKDGIEDTEFNYTTAPDDKWKVTVAGKYRLTFDLEHYTLEAEYLGEPDAPSKDPINAEAVYIVGDATPAGWNIDAPTQLTKKSQYVFVFEGELIAGDMKACIKIGDWGVPFIRPTFAECKISKEGVENGDFVFVANPDDKWKVTASGKYRLTFDLEHYTLTAEYLDGGSTPAKNPIDSETLYMIGDATPNGWSMDAPTAFTRDASNKYLFTWEGNLTVGSMKACLQPDGTFSCPFLRPSSADVEISASGVASSGFVYTTNPDDKWKVTEAGTYHITFDLEHYTIQVEKK